MQPKTVQLSVPAEPAYARSVRMMAANLAVVAGMVVDDVEDVRMAAEEGFVYTVGIEVMLAGDIVIAADTSRFAQLESKRGIAPLGGAHFRYLTRMGWGDAMYHLFLCDEFDAARAEKIGLVQEVVPAGEQIDRAMAIARRICENAPLGIQVTKEAALKFIEAGEVAAAAYVPQIRERVMGSADAREGIMSFVERRAAVFTGN